MNNLCGLGDIFIFLIYVLFGYWVVGISLLLGLGFWVGWGGVGVWWGLVGGLVSVVVLVNWRFFYWEVFGLIKG